MFRNPAINFKIPAGIVLPEMEKHFDPPRLFPANHDFDNRIFGNCLSISTAGNIKPIHNHIRKFFGLIQKRSIPHFAIYHIGSPLIRPGMHDTLRINKHLISYLSTDESILGHATPRRQQLFSRYKHLLTAH